MKNKKGAKQQKFIQTVQQQVSQMGRSAKQVNIENMLWTHFDNFLSN